MEKLFFELLQVAIGTRDSLSRVPSSLEWQQLLELSKKQALTAVAFHGVKTLSDSRIKNDGSGDGFDGGIGIDEMTYLKWLGLTAKVAQRNKVLDEQCREVCEVLEHDGFHTWVLKGQANQDLYPENLREFRTPGDIDVWVRPMGEIPLAVEVGTGCVEYVNYTGKEAVIRYVLLNTPEGKRKAVMNDMRQHHIDYHYYKDTAVEVHFTPSYFQSPIKNRRLQRWFGDHEEDCHVSSLGFKVGSVGFNAVYQMIHVYKHLFNEGVGLRQLLDYYFVLRALHIAQGDLSDRTQSMAQWAEDMGISVPSNTEIVQTLGRFGMKRFAGGVMWVLKEVFAMPDVYLLCEPNEVAGRFLLDEILMSGNFGKYDERNRKMQGASKLKRFFLLSQRNWRFFKQYPSEVFWDPFRRAYNVIWRKLEMWRY